MPGDAARVLYPPPHQGGAGGGGQPPTAVHQITLWLPQVNPTTLWEHQGRMDHLQHLEQEVLVCYGGLVVAQRHHQG